MTGKIKDLEYNAAKQKISQMRKLHGALIGLKETDDAEKPKTLSSLSVYSRPVR